MEMAPLLTPAGRRQPKVLGRARNAKAAAVEPARAQLQATPRTRGHPREPAWHLGKPSTKTLLPKARDMVRADEDRNTRRTQINRMSAAEGRQVVRPSEQLQKAELRRVLRQRQIRINPKAAGRVANGQPKNFRISPAPAPKQQMLQSITSRSWAPAAVAGAAKFRTRPPSQGSLGVNPPGCIRVAELKIGKGSRLRDRDTARVADKSQIRGIAVANTVNPHNRLLQARNNLVQVEVSKARAKPLGPLVSIKAVPRFGRRSRPRL
jgi:hypothetical protein